MTPPDQDLSLEKIFYGGFALLLAVAGLVLVGAAVKLKKLSRGPGRPPHLARPLAEEIPPNPVSPPASSPPGPPPAGEDRSTAR
jgi:hypothetical protein